MLKITNESEDKNVIVTARELRSGRDGESTTIEPGQSASVEIDGDHQLSIATTAREDGEAPLEQIPVAVVEGQTRDRTQADGDDPIEPVVDSSTAGVLAVDDLPAADDETVRFEINDMVTTGVKLTKGGFPELPVLNDRLKARGYGPVDATRRDSLMPAPVTT